MLNLNSEKFLSKKQISEIAPSVFTNRPSSEVTDKYTFISTEKVIDDMDVLGWKVFDAKQVN